MTVHLCSLKLRNPVILAAGLQGDTPEKLEAAYDAGAGAVVTKSVTIQPRQGYPEPRFVKLDNGWINAIGLGNVGAKEFARQLGTPTYPVIVSLAGSDPSDYTSMIGMFDGVAAFEINLSCPCVDGFGDDIGDVPLLAADIIGAAKSATDLPIFAKISHTMYKSVDVFIRAGIDGITAINTIPAMGINIKTRKPLISNVQGGLSGPPIKNIAINIVYRLSKLYDVPIMGCGGVSSWRDAVEFILAGATAVQVGSAAMVDVSILHDIAKDITIPAKST